MSAMANWVANGHTAPIIWMPMKDAATAHINEGTGGNFTLNGTIATSERGANQDNCVASYFDGSADYLSRTSLIGIADGKQVTFSCNFKIKTLSDDRSLFTLINSAYTSFTFNVYINVNGLLFIQGYSSSGQNLYFLSPASSFIINREYTLTLSIDLSNTANRNVIVNGKALSGTWSIYTNSNFYYTKPTLGSYIGIFYPPNTYLLNGDIGELYFDTKYIDLATNNPFWDKDTNKPKPVRQVIKETGVTPLIAMPLDASNAGKNYGTGGDFTANSAPYVGARGASEFWARSAKFDGTTSYLSSTRLVGISDSKYLTIVANVYKTASSVYFIISSGTGLSIQMQINSSNQLIIGGRNVNNVDIFNFTSTTTIPNLSWTTILVSIDLTNSSNRWIYFNNTYVTGTWSIYTNDFIKFSNLNFTIGTHSGTFTNSYNGSMSLWLDNTYTNFGQESNRLKYIDGLGYPTDLNKKVSDGIVTKPALYLDFNDTSNFGKNSGYGGDFVVNGTITAGADVLG